jgi:hypothetical protein
MSGADLPNKIQGIIFTEIIPELIPEIDTAALIRLGSIVRKTNRTALYEPLTDALRKVQWVKAVGLEAAAIEQEMESELEPGVILSNPFDQMKHSLAVTDAIIHTQSALDSLAVFLNNFLNVGKRSNFIQESRVR